MQNGGEPQRCWGLPTMLRVACVLPRIHTMHGQHWPGSSRGSLGAGKRILDFFPDSFSRRSFEEVVFPVMGETCVLCLETCSYVPPFGKSFFCPAGRMGDFSYSGRDVCPSQDLSTPRFERLCLTTARWVNVMSRIGKTGSYSAFC